MHTRFTIPLLLLLLTIGHGLCAAQDQKTNLPTLYLNTFDKRPITDKENYKYASFTLVSDTGVCHFDTIQIRGRGNSTWSLAKKPYRIKFLKKFKLLGENRAKAKSWTLLANHGDKSLLRNALSFRVSELLEMPFTPGSQFVDLVLNGVYLGNYQISDQVNVNKRRVNVVEQEDESNITGGYLIEVDGFGASEPYHFRTNRNVLISIKSPDDEFITTSQVNYIRGCVQNFENALFSNNFQDPIFGYRSHVDTTTLIHWYIATELTGNIDGFWSVYLYKQQDDPKLYFGPLWDFDIAYSNDNRLGETSQKMMSDIGFGSDLAKIWVLRMLEDPWFCRAVNRQWKALLSKSLETQLIQFTDSLANVLQASQALNYQRWRIDQRALREIYLYNNYQSYVDQVKRYLHTRIPYLTSVFDDRSDEPADDTPDTPTLEPFCLNPTFYYRITNKGNANVFDLAGQSTQEGTGLVLWERIFRRNTQHWQVVKVGQYYQFINRESQLALTDPTIDLNTYQTQLCMATPDSTDLRQLWDIVTVNINGTYNLINAFTKHGANNSGGGNTNGNAVISYKSGDGRDGISYNRMWFVDPEEAIVPPPSDTIPIEADSVPPVVDSIPPILPDSTLNRLEKVEREKRYTIVCPPYSQSLHLSSAEDLSGQTAVIYDLQSHVVKRFRADQAVSIGLLPKGVYIMECLSERQLFVIQ